MAKLLERVGKQAGPEFTKELNKIVCRLYLHLHPPSLMTSFRSTLAVNEPAAKM